jgi:hypothetical protein
MLLKRLLKIKSREFSADKKHAILIVLLVIECFDNKVCIVCVIVQKVQNVWILLVMLHDKLLDQCVSD